MVGDDGGRSWMEKKKKTIVSRWRRWLVLSGFVVSRFPFLLVSQSRDPEWKERKKERKKETAIDGRTGKKDPPTDRTMERWNDGSEEGSKSNEEDGRSVGRSLHLLVRIFLRRKGTYRVNVILCQKKPSDAIRASFPHSCRHKHEPYSGIITIRHGNTYALYSTLRVRRRSRCESRKILLEGGRKTVILFAPLCMTARSIIV